jgi:hypothetical protein
MNVDDCCVDPTTYCAAWHDNRHSVQGWNHCYGRFGPPTPTVPKLD